MNRRESTGSEPLAGSGQGDEQRSEGGRASGASGKRPQAGAPIAAEDLPTPALNEARAVTRELSEAGLDIPAGLDRTFAIYLTRVREWGRRTNLVATGDLDRLGQRHLLESFNVLMGPLTLDRGPLADAGSGAGFPGLPLALLLDQLEVVLVESVRKKARFLARLVGELELGGRVSIVAERVEVLAGQPPYRDRFAAVTVRGLGPLPRIVPWCAPLLRPRGVLVAFKGSDLESELRQAMGVMSAAGLELLDIVPLHWGHGRLVFLQRGD